MVGVPALVRMWLSGPSLRIGWPRPWRTRSSSISGRPNRKPKSERGEEGAAGAEGDVAEDVEDAEVLRQLGEVVEHRAASPLRRVATGRASPMRLIASTTRPTREPCEPLTMAMSPASSSRRARAAISAAVANHSPRTPRRQRLVQRPHPLAGAVRRWSISASAGTCGEAGVQRALLGPELEHVAEEGDAPAAGDPAERRRRAGRRRRPRRPPPSPPGWRCSSRRSA